MIRGHHAARREYACATKKTNGYNTTDSTIRVSKVCCKKYKSFFLVRV